jgi:hypothetical protein
VRRCAVEPGVPGRSTDFVSAKQSCLPLCFARKQGYPVEGGSRAKASAGAACADGFARRITWRPTPEVPRGTGC